MRPSIAGLRRHAGSSKSLGTFQTSPDTREMLEYRINGCARVLKGQGDSLRSSGFGPAKTDGGSRVRSRRILPGTRKNADAGTGVPGQAICRPDFGRGTSKELKPVSENWTRRFMDRHEIKKTKQKPIELARKEAHDPEGRNTEVVQ